MFYYLLDILYDGGIIPLRYITIMEIKGVNMRKFIMVIAIIVVVLIVSFWALVVSDVRSWFKYDEWSQHIKNEHSKTRERD